MRYKAQRKRETQSVPVSKANLVKVTFSLPELWGLYAQLNFQSVSRMVVAKLSLT